MLSSNQEDIGSMRHSMLLMLLTASISAFAGLATADFIDFVEVGDPGNPSDTLTFCTQADCGSVATSYFIGIFEVTNQQYARFLNAVADSDPNALYNTEMTTETRGGIVRSGSPGSYTYAAKNGRWYNPVVFASFYDTLRFANWLHNGQPTAPQGPGTTEDGAYTFTPAGVADNTIARNGGAEYFLPTENEWYKAAYYDPGSGTYYDYATSTNTKPVSGPPPGGANSANYWSGTYALTGSGIFDNGFNYLSNVGAYGSTVSPNGTFDQAGNVWEWNETIADPPAYRVKRGGDWNDQDAYLFAGLGVTGNPGTPGEDYETGFRIASVPEPGADLLAATAALLLAARRGWRRSARNLAA
jgi:formylglycine-generating enzyme required for sulfatase activity